MWNSYLNDDGVLSTEFGVLRNFLGTARIQHIFPRWVVDSDDTDPAYGADSASGNRHYFLQSAKSVPTWMPDRQGKLYGEAKPTIPFLYVTDAPGPAYYSPKHKTAVNMSLEFKTCVFKTADVPLRTNGVDVDLVKAIVCFQWDSKFVFDHTALVFYSPKNIDSECARPFTAREKNVHLLQFLQADEKLPHTP